jgi:hypothetical protein
MFVGGDTFDVAEAAEMAVTPAVRNDNVGDAS